MVNFPYGNNQLGHCQTTQENNNCNLQAYCSTCQFTSLDVAAQVTVSFRSEAQVDITFSTI